MRVKLSYTVDEEDVLKESAKLIRLLAPDLEHGIALFNESQQELNGEKDTGGVVNIRAAMEKIDELRKVLSDVDIRLFEVNEIISGFVEYQRSPPEEVTPEPEEVPGNLE